ncbi:MAG: trypsin-like peptidase domain-containing protein, partial [Myxococcales bacterium]|nr:trypsin-like peptidase domain-containing protein [Myxococcales bacterium]
MDTKFLDTIHKLIAEGELDIAVERLNETLTSAPPILRREATLLKARVAAANRKARMGHLTLEQHATQMSQLTSAALELLDEIPKLVDRARLPVDQPPSRDPSPTAETLEKIIGDNRLVSIAWLHRALAAASSVCLVQTPRGSGTAFVVQPGRILTNHHVLPSREVAGKSQFVFNFEEDANGRLHEPTFYNCDSSSYRGDAFLDYAAVDLLPATETSPSVETLTPLRASTANLPNPGDYVCIIQHPSGGPKKIAVSENQVVHVYEHRLQYVTDTKPGSSGSPVFDDDWNVVALHHAGGQMVRDASGTRHFVNEGVLLKHIADH